MFVDMTSMDDRLPLAFGGLLSICLFIWVLLKATLARTKQNDERKTGMKLQDSSTRDPIVDENCSLFSQLEPANPGDLEILAQILENASDKTKNRVSLLRNLFVELEVTSPARCLLLSRREGLSRAIELYKKVNGTPEVLALDQKQVSSLVLKLLKEHYSSLMQAMMKEGEEQAMDKFWRMNGLQHPGGPNNTANSAAVVRAIYGGSQRISASASPSGPVLVKMRSSRRPRNPNAIFEPNSAVILSGWLKKRTTRRIAHWQSRFFRINTDYLTYCRDEQQIDGKLGALPLCQIESIQIDARKHGAKTDIIVNLAKDPSLKLRAATPMEASKWVTHLRIAVETAKNTAWEEGKSSAPLEEPRANPRRASGTQGMPNFRALSSIAPGLKRTASRIQALGPVQNASRAIRRSRNTSESSQDHAVDRLLGWAVEKLSTRFPEEYASIAHAIAAAEAPDDLSQTASVQSGSSAALPDAEEPRVKALKRTLSVSSMQSNNSMQSVQYGGPAGIDVVLQKFYLRQHLEAVGYDQLQAQALWMDNFVWRMDYFRSAVPPVAGLPLPPLAHLGPLRPKLSHPALLRRRLQATAGAVGAGIRKSIHSGIRGPLRHVPPERLLGGAARAGSRGRGDDGAIARGKPGWRSQSPHTGAVQRKALLNLIAKGIQPRWCGLDYSGSPVEHWTPCAIDTAVFDVSKVLRDERYMDNVLRVLVDLAEGHNGRLRSHCSGSNASASGVLILDLAGFQTVHLDSLPLVASVLCQLKHRYPARFSSIFVVRANWMAAAYWEMLVAKLEHEGISWEHDECDVFWLPEEDYVKVLKKFMPVFTIPAELCGVAPITA